MGFGALLSNHSSALNFQVSLTDRTLSRTIRHLLLLVFVGVRDDNDVARHLLNDRSHVGQAIPDAGIYFTIHFLNISNGNAKVERSEEHTSELQSLMRISYAVFCLKKKNKKIKKKNKHTK